METRLSGLWSRRSRESAAKTSSLPSPSRTEQWAAAERRPSCWLTFSLKRLHLLKQCTHELFVRLTTVFTACLRENIWSSLWKEAQVVPVHKKSSRSDPKNYRPISLLSVVGKVFKRIVNGQASEPLPVEASVSQGFMLGHVLWNIYVDDFLRQLPAISAYTDD